MYENIEYEEYYDSEPIDHCDFSISIPWSSWQFPKLSAEFYKKIQEEKEGEMNRLSKEVPVYMKYDIIFVQISDDTRLNCFLN